MNNRTVMTDKDALDRIRNTLNREAMWDAETFETIAGLVRATGRRIGGEVIVPVSHEEALAWLKPLLDLDAKQLSELPDQRFKQAWAAIFYLYPGLHPDGATDTDGVIETEPSELPGDKRNYPEGVEPRMLAPYYLESGWPVVLVPIAIEAWHRYDAGDFTDDEFYCVAASRGGQGL